MINVDTEVYSEFYENFMFIESLMDLDNSYDWYTGIGDYYECELAMFLTYIDGRDHDKLKSDVSVDAFVHDFENSFKGVYEHLSDLVYHYSQYKIPLDLIPFMDYDLLAEAIMEGGQYQIIKYNDEYYLFETIY